MEIRLTARLLGDPLKPFGEQIDDEEWERPLTARPSVEIVVDSSTTLDAALESARHALEDELGRGDFTAAGNFVAFSTEDDVDGITGRWPRLDTTVTLPDGEGRATWNHPPFEVDYSDLLRASEAELLVGDPIQPYVVLEPGIGDGFLGTWDDVVRAWHVFWQFLEAMDTTGGVAGIAFTLRELYRRRVRDAAKVIEDHAAEWRERGALPFDVGALLDAKSRTLVSNARLLGITPDEAEALLTARGWRLQSGIWVPSAVPVDRIAQGIAKHLDYASSSDEDQLRQALMRIVEGRDPWE